jgi:hypothetical protein
VKGKTIGGRYCSYRWDLEGRIPFSRSIKVTIEHGRANHPSDNYSGEKSLRDAVSQAW